MLWTSALPCVCPGRVCLGPRRHCFKLQTCQTRILQRFCLCLAQKVFLGVGVPGLVQDLSLAAKTQLWTVSDRDQSRKN
jgi:hypothetical protein